MKYSCWEKVQSVYCIISLTSWRWSKFYLTLFHSLLTILQAFLSNGLWAGLPKANECCQMHTAGTELAWLDALQPPGSYSHHSLGRCCAMVFLSSDLSGELWLTGSSRVQACLAGKDSVPSTPALCLSAAHSQSPWWPRGWYKSQIGFATLYWIPAVISNDFWWWRNRTHLVPNQVFLVWAKPSWTLQHWWGVSLIIVSVELLPAEKNRTVILNPLQEPCGCLESELAFLYGADN